MVVSTLFGSYLSLSDSLSVHCHSAASLSDVQVDAQQSSVFFFHFRLTGKLYLALFVLDAARLPSLNESINRASYCQ